MPIFYGSDVDQMAVILDTNGGKGSCQECICYVSRVLLLADFTG
jgi:hypothetical protein